MDDLFPVGGAPAYKIYRALLRKDLRVFQKLMQNPRAAQVNRFQQILRLSQNSAYGKEHLQEVRSLEEFRTKVPIHSYVDLEPWIARIANGEHNVLQRNKVTSFVETSGTTARPKLIPVTKEWAAHISSAQRLWMLSLLGAHPKIADGFALNIVSSSEERNTSGGLPIGANTGRMQSNLSRRLARRFVLPDAIHLVKNPEAKIYTALRFALQAPITSWTTANPSMILLYCRKMKEHRQHLAYDLNNATLRSGPAEQISSTVRGILEQHLRPYPVPLFWQPARIWPLALVNCWKGGSAGYFVSRLSEALGAEITVRDVGVTASEGYFAIPLCDDWDGGVLWTAGEVMEFRDSSGRLYWPWEVRVGEQYELIITTSTGLFRYDLKDVVEVTGFYSKTPIVRFVGKAGRYLNSVGEKVSEEQVSLAIRTLDSHVIGFTGRIRWSEIPYIEVAIEAVDLPPNIDIRLDEALQTLNVEYASKRKSGRLGGVRVTVVPTGTYDRFRQRRVRKGATMAQVKDPIISTTPEDWIVQEPD